MISEDKQYEYLGSVVADRLEGIRNAYKLFLQLFSAIVGGSIWLSMQAITPMARTTFATVSNVLVWIVIVVTGTMVLEALRGWWGYRKAMATLDERIPGPKVKALGAEMVMIASMVAGGILFGKFNPFLIVAQGGSPAPALLPPG